MNSKELREELAKLYGMASSFRMLDTEDEDLKAEVQAAKDTGEMIRKQIDLIMRKL